MKRAIAPNTTAGVYIRANLAMNSSDFAFREPAFSVRSKIFDTVDSPNSFSVRIFNTPLVFIAPLITLSPTVTFVGMLSPVKAAVSRSARPSVTTPSMGIFSPGFATIMEPIATSSGSTRIICPSFSIFA